MASGLGGDAFFRATARLVTRRPALVLVVVGVLLVLVATLLPGLGVSTSRTGLVSPEEPQQARMNAFFERFGRPDAPVFLISGGTIEQRQAVVDRLQTALESDPELDLKGRILGRVSPEDISSVLLLQQPEALAQLRQSLPPGTDLSTFIEQGLQAWLTGLATNIEQGLEGAEGSEGEGAPAGIDQAAAGLDQLAMVAGLLDDYLAGRDSLERLEGQAQVGRAGLDDKGYVTTAQGEHYIVSVFAELDSDEGAVLEPLVARLREIRDEVLAESPDGITAELTGLPAFSVDELGVVQRGLMTSSAVTGLGIALLCLVLFRSLRQTIVALTPLLPGLVITLAAVRVMYDDLNLVTSGFVAVLLGLGIDFSVHFIARRNEQVRAGDGEVEAIGVALRKTGPGIMTGAVVTAAAFLTTGTTEFTAYAELGIATAIGLVVIMLGTFFVLPPLLMIGRKSDAKAAPEPPGIGAIDPVVRRSGRVLLVLAILAAVGGAFALPRIAFNSRYFSFLPQSTESAHALLAIEYDPLASPVFASVTAESIEEARKETEELRALDSVAGVQSPTDLLPELTPPRLAALRAGFEGVGKDPDFAALASTKLDAEALAKTVRRVSDDLDEVRYALEGAGGPVEGAKKAVAAFEALHGRLTNLDAEGKARLDALHPTLAALLNPAWTTARAVAKRGEYLPSDLPPLFARRYASRDRTAVAMYAVPSGNFWDKEVAEKFSADVRRIDPEASGLAMIHVAHGQMVLKGFRRAALYAAAVIIVLLVIDFRSFKDALLALLPTALGWLWMLGVMALAGLDFNIANIVALPLVLGIGIAFGVHMMHRVRETAHPDPSESGPVGDTPSLDEVIRGTGGAILVAALTTMVGFGGLMTADYGAMKSMGLVMVIGIATCLLATVFVLPAVLHLLGRAK
jgi:predicted RND superfamily exporter protein